MGTRGGVEQDQLLQYWPVGAMTSISEGLSFLRDRNYYLTCGESYTSGISINKV